MWGRRKGRDSVGWREPRRVFACLIYYSVARHLPMSTRPYAVGCRRVRAALARWMFADCGENVNVEHGADFFSGRQVSIGDNSGLGVDSLILGPVTIGANVMMGPRVMLLATNHNTSRVDIPMIRQGMKEDRRIVIEEGLTGKPASPLYSAWWKRPGGQAPSAPTTKGPLGWYCLSGSARPGTIFAHGRRPRQRPP
jgi:hypothetical protein